MSQLSETFPQHPKRNLSRSNSSVEALAQHTTIREGLAAQCRPIFEKLRPELMENYYNWFIAIAPDSEHYLIAHNLEGLVKKISHEYPEEKERKLTIYCLNETGACGKI